MVAGYDFNSEQWGVEVRVDTSTSSRKLTLVGYLISEENKLGKTKNIRSSEIIAPDQVVLRADEQLLLLQPQKIVPNSIG